MHHRAFRYRLYPDEGQERLFRQTAGSCRVVYNLALEQWRTFSRSGRSITYNAQANELPALKADLPWLRDVPSHCLQQALRDAHDAIQRFFKGETGYPRFRSKYRHASFRFPDPLQFEARQIGLDLPKAGLVPWIMHRPMTGKPKSVTVVREADAWYASVLCEIAEDLPEAAPATMAAEINALAVTGVDFGVEVPLAASDGTMLDLPKTPSRRSERKCRLQRTMKRQKRGSKNYAKTRRALARLEARQARRRRDTAHKAARCLLAGCDVLGLEALKIKNMTASAAGTIEEPGTNVAQKSGLNRSILDLSPGQFRLIAQWQAAKAGKRVVAVNPAYSSQECPECRHTSAANRPRRDLFCCERCGFSWHADTVAAINIEGRAREALRALAPRPAEDRSARRRTSGGSPRRAPRRASLRSGKRTEQGAALAPQAGKPRRLRRGEVPRSGMPEA